MVEQIKIMTKKVSIKAGFTLLEILLVVGIISILAGIVILAINPTKQLGDTRNAQRRSDVLTILNAAYQFSIDNSGYLPASTTLTTNTCGLDDEIGVDDASVIDLYAELVVSASDATYLTAMPTDPQATSTASGAGSGYAIVKTSSGRLTVCAPLAENDAVISVTR